MSTLTRRIAAIVLLTVMAAAGCGTDGDATDMGNGPGGSSGRSEHQGGAEPTASFVPVTDNLYVQITSKQAKDLERCIKDNGPLRPGGNCSTPKRGWLPGRCPVRRLCVSIFAAPAQGDQAKIAFTDNRADKSFCADRTSSLCAGVTMTREQAAAVANQQAEVEPKVSDPTPSAQASDEGPTRETTIEPDPTAEPPDPEMPDDDPS
jgi:hypothetical protein